MSTEFNSRDEAVRILDNYTKKILERGSQTEPRTRTLQPTDIIITPFSKAGTTLMQNMTYQITVATGGAPLSDPDGTNFTDITMVCPWIDYQTQLGGFESLTNPHIFKSHSPVEKFNLEQAKYIYVVRNPTSFPGSWLDFVGKSHDFICAESKDVQYELVQEAFGRKILGIPNATEEQIRNFVEGREVPKFGEWFDHVDGWLKASRSNVLILFYEDIVEDMRSAIISVANFMDRTISEDAIKRVMERCDRKAMTNDPKFKCGIEQQHFGLTEAWKVLPKDRKGYKEYSINPMLLDLLQKGMQEYFQVSSYDELRKQYSKRG